MKRLLPLLLFFSGFAASSFGQCDTATQVKIKIEIHTDQFPSENSWTLKELNGPTLRSGGPFLLRNRTILDSLCVEKGKCLVFQMNDSGGDGMCCQSGQGGFKLFVNGILKEEGGKFLGLDRRYLECAEGMTCQSAFVATTGQFLAETKPDTWYQFTPSEAGRYRISTCENGNACNTAIWIYDRCDGLIWDNTLLGSIFFNDNHCDQLAEITVPLIANKPYYFRIGSMDNSCANQPVFWRLEYLGAAVGCTDLFACNYNPVATEDDGSCIYPGNPDCPAGPDLKIFGDLFKASMYLDEIINTDQCMIEEGCLKGYQNRTIIRFETTFENVGTKDFYIGFPPSNPQNANEQWEWDNCHNHWHYEGYAEYLLFNQLGEKLPVGFKNGFCVLDFQCKPGISERYTCDNQGLSAGCRDV